MEKKNMQNTKNTFVAISIYIFSKNQNQKAQLFSTNAFGLNVLSTFTAIYSQSIVNTNNIFTYFYQRK